MTFVLYPMDAYLTQLLTSFEDPETIAAALFGALVALLVMLPLQSLRAKRQIRRVRADSDAVLAEVQEKLREAEDARTAAESEREDVRRAQEVSATELERTKKELDEARARHEDLLKGNQGLAEKVASASTFIQSLSEEVIKLTTENNSLSMQLEQRESKIDEQKEFIESAKEELKKAFISLSATALKYNNEKFLVVANSIIDKKVESAEEQLTERQERFEVLSGSVREVLTKVQEQIEEMEVRRTEQYQNLDEHIASVIACSQKLNEEAERIQRTLKGSTGRAVWGHYQLRELLHEAGMAAFSQFRSDVDEGADSLEPDAVIELPNERRVAVDASAPISSYVAAIEAEETDAQHYLFGEFVKDLRTHVEEVGGREYGKRGPEMLDVTFVFLAAESFLYTALDRDPGLLKFAFEKRVLLVTPSSLLAFLRLVSFSWEEKKLHQNAQQIASLGVELYQRLQRFNDLFGNLGRTLGKAVSQYNRVAQVERRVMTSARQFETLGAPRLPQTDAPTVIETPVTILEADVDDVRELLESDETKDEGVSPSNAAARPHPKR